MKIHFKNIKRFTCLFLISIIGLVSIGCDNKPLPNPGNRYIFSKAEKEIQTQESMWFKDYFMPKIGNPYNNFINQKTYLLDHTPASQAAITKFANLYDRRGSARIGKDFLSLNQNLTETKLSDNVQLNLNGNQLFCQVTNDQRLIFKADQELLRFYNIIAKVYQLKVAISLVQSISLNVTLNLHCSDDIAAVSHYSYKKNGVFQIYYPSFINQQKISESFLDGFIVSANLITMIIHEYGHALSGYVLDNDEQRRSFNTYPFNNISMRQNYHHFSFLNRNTSNYIFSDPTSVLMQFLNSEGNIEPNDPVQNTLFPMLVVRSGYGETAGDQNNVFERDELFAEAFTRGITTLNIDRDYEGELLNKFFMDYFPSYYRL